MQIKMTQYLNLFLVTSPFQYICAVEAKHQYSAKNNVLVLMAQSGKLGIQQQNNVFEPDDWDYVVHLDRRSRSTTIPQCIRKVRKLAGKRKISTFFHGEYNSWHAKLFLRNLKPEREVVFDDGTLTINDYEENIRHKLPYKRAYSKLFSDLTVLLNGCMPVRYIEQHSQLELFSIFNIKNPQHVVRHNQLQILRRKYNCPSLFDKNAPVGFIGQGAIGSKHQKTIETYVEEVKRFTKIIDKPIIYFPHRTESKEVEKAVTAIPRLTYHRSELPLEIELIDKKIYLSGLVGCNSTAQFTAMIMYPGIKVYNIKTSMKVYDEFSKQNQRRVNNINNLLLDAGVCEIEL